MVNFKVKLENDIVEKWRNHYIDYKTLENSISQNNRKHERKSPRGLGTFSFQKPLLEAPSFAETYDAEIEKVEIFYCTKMAELKTRYEQQMEQNAKEEKITDIDLEDEEKAASSSLISTESLKRSMLKFYRQLKYLQSFCILNYTGFVKILKKHNKAMERNKTTRMDTSSSKREIDSKKDRATAVPSIINVAEDDAAASEIIIGSPSVSSSHHLSPPNESSNAIIRAATNNRLRKQLDLQGFSRAVQPGGGLLELVKEAEMLYARKFCGDDIVQAQAELLSKQATTSFDWRLFQLGYRFGACLILTFWLLWDSIVDTLYRPPQNSNWLHSMFPIYRAYFCLVLMLWLAGCMSFVWNKYRINYIYIFELDPRKVPTLDEIFGKATNATILVMTNFLLYYKVLRGDFPHWLPAPYLPMILVLTSIGWALANLNSCKGIGMVCWQVVSLLWLGGEVNFLTAFVADVFTSMAKLWVDLAYTFCVLFTGSWLHDSDELTQSRCAKNKFFVSVIKVLVTTLPLYFRFVQNVKLYRRTVRPFPFLANAMKYVVSMAVSLFSTLHAASEVRKDPAPYTAFYILFTCIATIYSYVWDITMDWGLARKSHGGLRERLMFGNRWIYYTVILVDLIGRFMWVITLMPRNDNPIPLFPDLVTPFLAAIELCRRAMWGCFRLENEHLHNTGFRRFEGPVPDHFDSAMQTKPEPERKTLWQVAKEMSLMVGLGGALIGISIYFGISKD